MGNSGCFPREKPASTESRYQTYGACRVFQSFLNPPNFDTDHRILNGRTDVNACGWSLGFTDTGRESALEVDSERKIPRRTRVEPVSAACRSDALPTELHPHHLSYFHGA